MGPHHDDPSRDDDRSNDEAAARKRRDASADTDFAEEHESTTFADEMPGGPEGVKEPVSPTGRGGDGGMDVGSEPDNEYRDPD